MTKFCQKKYFVFYLNMKRCGNPKKTQNWNHFYQNCKHMRNSMIEWFKLKQNGTQINIRNAEPSGDFHRFPSSLSSLVIWIIDSQPLWAIHNDIKAMKSPKNRQSSYCKALIVNKFVICSFSITQWWRYKKIWLLPADVSMLMCVWGKHWLSV